MCREESWCCLFIVRRIPAGTGQLTRRGADEHPLRGRRNPKRLKIEESSASMAEPHFP
jgi:hypothetical protein